jgi:hypothetical protein
MKKFVALVALILLPLNFAFAATEASNTFSTSLSGSTQYWSAAAPTYTGDHTEICWVKMAAQPSNANWALVSKYAGAGSQRSWLYDYEDSSGTKSLHVRTSSNGSTVLEGGINQTLTTGTWYGIAWVYTASAGTIQIYVNASSIGTVSSLATSLLSSTAQYQLGGNSDLGWYTNGQLDGCLSYAAALSGAQVSALYNTPCAPSATNLTSWFQFNNNGNDSQGSNNLTNNNSATFSSNVAYSCASAAAFAPWQFWAF